MVSKNRAGQRVMDDIFSNSSGSPCCYTGERQLRLVLWLTKAIRKCSLWPWNYSQWWHDIPFPWSSAIWLMRGLTDKPYWPYSKKFGQPYLDLFSFESKLNNYLKRNFWKNTREAKKQRLNAGAEDAKEGRKGLCKGWASIFPGKWLASLRTAMLL